MTHKRLSNEKGSVFISLGEDIRIVLVGRMVASSRRQRMVARNITDVSFVFAVMARRRAFFQEDPSIVSFAVWLFVAPFDKVKVEPGFVMATLVSRADAKSFMGNGECAMLTNFPVSIRIRRFEQSTNVLPLTWNCSRSPQWCGAGRHRQSAVSRSLFNVSKYCCCCRVATQPR